VGEQPEDVNVEFPKRRLTVFTGVSGSGKSSLVFDTIAAERGWRSLPQVVRRIMAR
jgi:excinuclease UvrABC ATPase subunit